MKDFKNLVIKSETLRNAATLKLMEGDKLIGLWDRVEKELTLFLPTCEVRQTNLPSLLTYLHKWIELDFDEFEETAVRDAWGDLVAIVKYSITWHYLINNHKVSPSSFWSKLNDAADNSIDFGIYKERLQLGSKEIINDIKFQIVKDYEWVQDPTYIKEASNE